MQRLLLVLLLLYSSLLKAQNDINDFFSMSLEELMQVEITSSTLTPENLKTVPSAVSVYTHEEIKRLGLDTLGELMNLIPGFQLYRSSGSSLETPFSSRGRRIGEIPAEILVLLDGHRFDSPRSSGSATLAPNYPLKYIKKVEFIRGPGAAIYGSNAMMGVINIVSLPAVEQLDISLGSFNRRKLFLQSTKKIGEVTLDIMGRYETDEGEKYTVQDTFSSNTIGTRDPRSQADLYIKLKWGKTFINIQHNQFKVDGFYELNTLSEDFNSRSGQIDSISLKHDFNWQNVNSYVWFSFIHTDASVASQFTAPGDLSQISSPQSNDPLRIQANFNNSQESRAQLHNNWKINNYSSLQFGVEVRRIMTKEALAKNNFDLGDLANLNLPITFYGERQATTPVQAGSSRDIIGLYSQYQKNIFSTTHLTLGLRYDDFSAIGSQLSPRIGLVQELNPQQSLKLLYGEAFRAPSESELNLLNNPVLLGNPDLKPESVKSVDVIWVGQWNQTSVSTGYFENRFSDSIVVSSDINQPPQYKNMPQDPTKGYEFELSHEFNKHWLVRSSYTYISDKPALSYREANNLASLSINYQQAHWNANLLTTYRSARQMFTNNSPELIPLNDYWLVFTKIRYKFSADIIGYFQIKNLLDETYFTPPANSALTQGIINRRREVLLGLSWNF